MSRKSTLAVKDAPDARPLPEKGDTVRRAGLLNSDIETYLATRVSVSHLLLKALSAFEESSENARELVEQAYSLVTIGVCVSSKESGALAGWQVRKALQYIHGNLEAPLRMNSAARLVSLSDGHFSRAFKLSTGLAYSQYVIHARIDFAKHLLRTSDASVAEIAQMCGLSDQSHLNRLFKKVVGLSPRTYRNLTVDVELDDDHDSSKMAYLSKPSAKTRFKPDV